MQKKTLTQTYKEKQSKKKKCHKIKTVPFVYYNIDVIRKHMPFFTQIFVVFSAFFYMKYIIVYNYLII